MSPGKAPDKLRAARDTLRKAGALALLLPALIWHGDSRAAELGGFFPYTVYTDEKLPAEAYKDEVILLLHGFKSAMPNSTYRVFKEAFGEDRTVVGYNYDYVDVAANLSDLDQLYEKFLKDRRVIVVGTSLGGFWADHIAKRYPVDGAILINPVIRPDDTMRRHLGEQYSKKRQMSFLVTQQAVEDYAALRQKEDSPADRLVVLAKDDQVLDYRDAVAVFEAKTDSKTVILEDGGHSIDMSRADVMATVRGFIDRVWQP